MCVLINIFPFLCVSLISCSHATVHWTSGICRRGFKCQPLSTCGWKRVYWCVPSGIWWHSWHPQGCSHDQSELCSIFNVFCVTRDLFSTWNPPLVGSSWYGLRELSCSTFFQEVKACSQYRLFHSRVPCLLPIVTALCANVPDAVVDSMCETLRAAGDSVNPWWTCVMQDQT